MDPLTDLLLRKESLYLVAGVWILLETLRRVLPKMAAHAVYVRLAPVLPILLCEGAMWIPGLFDDLTSAHKVLVGLILGYASAHTRKVLTQSILGRDPLLVKNGASVAGVQLDAQPSAPELPKGEGP